jgi:acylphosphatase
MVNKICVEVVVFGKVHNVFFRKFVRDNAISLNLLGYVRNNYDNGTVEALFEGDLKNIEDMIDLLWVGSEGSDVENVIVNKFVYKGSYDFFTIVS